MEAMATESSRLASPWSQSDDIVVPGQWLKEYPGVGKYIVVKAFTAHQKASPIYVRDNPFQPF